MINKDSDNISIYGHIGTWHIIDQLTDNRGSFFLLEHDRYGDEAASLIVDMDGCIILDDVFNGFSDLDDISTEEITHNRVGFIVKKLQAEGCLFLRDLGKKTVVFPVEALRALRESELPVAKEIVLNDQGLSDRAFELISLAHAVDAYYMTQDAYGYGDSFDSADVFNDQELRINYMKEHLKDPIGLSATIESIRSDITDDAETSVIASALEMEGRLLDYARYVHDNVASVPILAANFAAMKKYEEQER